MLKAVLIDDDLHNIYVLKELLQRYCAGDVIISGSAQTIDEAYELILSIKPELVLLDVQLGNQTAFDLLSRFPDLFFKVIFVTAYDQYAIEAIKFNALGYILKPVAIMELVNAIQKVKNAGKISVSTDLNSLIHMLAHRQHKEKRIAVPVLNGYKMIAVEDILYCEASKEYTNIHLADQPLVCSSINLGEYEELLQEYSFCRVHHSFLVNRDYVKQYIKGEGGELIMNKNTVIPVSRRKKQEVIQWLSIGKW